MKRIGSILVTLVLLLSSLLTVLPTSALAEETTVTLGAVALTAGNKVWFGSYSSSPVLWRVLQSGDGKALLISNDTLDKIMFNQHLSNGNAWSGSNAQSWCSSFYTNWPDGIEKDAILATSVEEENNQSAGSMQYYYQGGYQNGYRYGAAPLNNEHFFFLSAKEADTLFTNDDDRKASGADSFWWLRSSNTRYSERAGVVENVGWVKAHSFVSDLGARPAFNLNLSSVLFSSLIQSNQYKLTLADSNRTIGIRAAITRDSATQITVPYTKDSGSNHVSLLITNKNDSWTAGSGWSTGAVKQYYATAAVSEANGTVTFTLPDNYETNKGNWKVWLLAEKVNGEHETDYASAPTAITVPAYMPKVAYVDAKGNTPADSPVVCTPVTASDTTWGAAGQTTWYAVTDSVTITNRVEVQGSVNLILCDGETLTAEKGITVSGDNNSLTIWAQSGGTGKLYAGTTDGTDFTCLNTSCAGIGGGDYAAGGEVTVNGGTVYATGGNGGAGIGGGYRGAGGKVTINGGTVNATGGPFGAGIGGGANRDGGTVTVTGGTVYATGNSSGAGIGGGKNGAGGEVTINGGTVYATGKSGGAGIGGGNYGDGGTVKITGGTVYAQANGRSAQAIGHGDEKSTAGSLEIYAGAKVTAGEDDSSASLVQDGTARVDACRDNQYAAIEPCENHSYTKYKNITDTTHTPVCAYCLNEGTATAHTFVNHKCVCGKQESYTVTLHTNGGTIASGKDVTGYTHGTGAALPTAADISWTGFTFNGWFDNENLTGSAVTAISATDTGNKIYWAKWTADPATAPVFTTQPQSVKLGLNAAGGNALTAATESISGHKITYQWYVNTSNSNDGGTPITGANAASYAAPTDDLGTKYYYCVATATRDDNGQTASTKSDPAAVEMLRFITHTVTFEVVGGSWDDENKTTANQTVEFTYPDDEDFAPVLQAGQVPAVGSSPDAGHLTGGTWTEGDSVVTMPPDEAIRRDRTFTFTYTAKGQSAVAKAPEAKTLTYNGAAQALVTAGEAVNGGMQYTLGTETAPGTDWSGDIPERTDAGTYYVWYKAQGDATHLDSEPKPVSAGITPKSITGATVTLDKTQLGYTSAEQTVTVTGVAIDGLTLTENNYDVTGNTGTNAANYTVTVTGKGNFQDTATAEWKIVEAGMTLSAPDVSATYDGQPHGITVTVSEPAGAVVKFKDEAGAYTLDASPAITNAGSLVVGYQITADNYVPVTGSATVTVTPKAATVTASAQTVKEGESIQTGTEWAALTDALSGHTLSAVTLTAENGKIVPSAAKIQDAKGNDVTGNYDVSYQPGALTALGKISHTVTFKVVNGAWDDGTVETKTVALTGFAGDTLKLATADIPAVGAKPGDAFKAGAWDVVPSTEAEITADMTYTYTYADKDAISQTVTFKVVNGAWDDGTTADKVATLNGLEGDTLKLAANQIPAVGNKPADAYKAGAWDVTPSTETAITAPTTYTYSYAPKDGISQTVTFKVVNGSWDDGTASDKTVTLTGHEGDTLKLTADQIPAVGNKPAANYQAGSWDVTPSTETIITGPTAYTYTYAPVTSYTTTSGDGQEYRINSNDDLEFIVKCSVNDELTFPNFRSAALDGQTLGTADYDTAQGSLIFTLKAAKATTLALGTHTLTFTFTDGTATATFTVKPVAGSFEDVVVPSDTFTFRKEWQGSSEKSINFTLYKLDGSVYHHGFDKQVVSNREWRYNAWFSSPAACYVIEEPIPGYITKYVNVGVYAGVTDRCCDGGTIINKKIPKTGDEAPLLLWACCAVIGVIGVTAGVVTYNKMRKNTKK